MVIILLNMEKVVRIVVNMYKNQKMVQLLLKRTHFSKVIACFISQQTFYPCVVSMPSSTEYYFVYIQVNICQVMDE